MVAAVAAAAAAVVVVAAAAFAERPSGLAMMAVVIQVLIKAKSQRFDIILQVNTHAHPWVLRWR